MSDHDRKLTKWVAKCVVLIATALLLVSCGKPEEPAPREVVRPVKLFTVSSSEGGAQRSFPGRVRASQRVDLSFQVAGPLVKLPVEEGQTIAKGELVALIKPRDFQSRLDRIRGSLGEARARLRAMQVGARPEELAALKAAVEAAKARLVNAEEQYKRYKALYASRQVSKAEFDKYKSEYDVAVAALTTQQQSLEVGLKGARDEDIEAMQANIRGLEAQEKTAADALDDTYLRAPFSGVIARRLVENFEEVRAKQPIVSLQDISRVEVLVEVPELVMATIRRGQGGVRAVARFAAAPGREFPVSLKEFSTEADPRTQTYQVTLLMDQPEGVKILPGMTGNVVAVVPTGETGAGPVVVPAVAVFSGPTGNPQVWVVDREAMTVSRVAVTTGELAGTDGVEILEGLQPGDTLAVSGVTQLRQGMKVRDLSELEGYGR